MTSFNLAKEHYLGDGLYVRFDGYSYILRAPREEGDHWVSLEPSVLSELKSFERKVLLELKRQDEGL